MNLLASSLLGGLYLLILSGICFAAVALVRCALLYNAQRKRKPQKEERPAPKPATGEQTPEKQRVYYIVEKKRVSRSRAKYAEPKKIRFE